MGVVAEPNESRFASEANSPPVAATWRRSMLASSLYPTRPGKFAGVGTPSKAMFGSAACDHAGVVGSTEPSMKYPVSPVSGLPSQCDVAGLAVELGATALYHAEVEYVA